jgi:uracil permease
VTTYAEVTGAISLTKITDPAVIRIAAVTGIVFSVIGKVSAVLKSIPDSVLGGIMMLLFGTIASVGISTLVNAKTDMSNTRNLIIVSLTLTFGIGGAIFQVGEFSMTGIGLAALIGVLLNLILPNRIPEKEKETN